MTSCKLSDPTCSALCLCDAGYIGLACDKERKNLRSFQITQEYLCSDLDSYKISADSAGVVQRVGFVRLLLADMSVISF